MFTVIFPPAIGGPATQCFNLCRALREKNIQPVVVTYGEAFGRSETDGYPVYTFQRFYGLGPLDRILRWLIFPFYIASVLRSEKIDILHCHSVNMLSFAAAGVAKLMRIPRVLKFAGDWVWETLSTHRLQKEEDFRAIYRRSLYSRFLTWVEKSGLRLFDVIWTPSQFRRQNVEYLIGQKVPTVIIPNALLFDDAGGAHAVDENDLIIVSANRFIPHKRIQWLVEAYAAVANSRVKLVLIGGGDQKQETAVKEKIKKTGLENSIALTGVLNSPEVYKIFSKAAFYVSASLEEGFPNVFIEAMHYGLPIITTDAGGSREMVVNGETGFVIPINDRRALEEKMKILIENKNLREQMAKKAHERSKLFDLRQRVGEFAAMYQRLLTR